MKKSFILAAVLVAALTSCQKEVQEIREGGEGVVVASREAVLDTKAALGDNGAFTWSKGDAIAIYDGSSKWNKFVTQDDGVSSATFVYESTGFGNPAKAGYAVYPYALGPKLAGDALSVELPASYEWVENQTNVPMLATFEKNPSKISFKHLGGVVKLTLNGVPAGEGTLTFWADKAIAGEFAVDRSGDVPQINTADKTDDNSQVTIMFTNEAARNMDFYVPVPVGSYVFGLKLESDGLSAAKQLQATVANTVDRRDILVMPALEVGSVIGGGDDVAANLTVDETLAATTLYLPSTTGVVNVVFNEKQTAAITLAYDPLGDKPEKVYVSAGENTITNLTITLPFSHVELLDGTYTNVTASTGESTLVVNKGVKIDSKLIVNKGDLVFNGTTKDVASVEMKNGTSVTVGEFDSATGNGRVATLTVTKGKNVTVNGKVGTLTVTAAEAVNVAEKADVETLNFSTSTATGVIAGKVGTLTGSSNAQDITIKTTGSFTSLGGKNNATIYAERGNGETDDALKSRLGSAGNLNNFTVLDLFGLQNLIETDADGVFELASAGNYSAETYEIGGEKGKKAITITVNGSTVIGKFVVYEGATLTLEGAGTLKSGTDGYVIENHGTVVLGDGSNSITYNGDIRNDGKLTIKASAGTFVGKVVNNGKDLTVATGITLPEVVEGESTMAYAATEAAINTAIAATNADNSYKISKVIVNNASSLSVNDAIAIKGTAAAPRILAVELRSGITATTDKDVFDIQYADVDFTAYGNVARTITAVSGQSAIVVSNNGSATGENKTKVTLGENVVLAGNQGIKIGSNNWGVEVISKADISATTSFAVAANGASKSKPTNAPVITLNGGNVSTGITADNYAVWNLNEGAKVKSITGTNYAKWNINGATIDNSAAGDGISLTAGDVTITNAKTVVKGQTNAINITGNTTSVKNFAINGGNFSGAISSTGDTAVKDFIKLNNTASFDDLSAMKYGEDGAVVNIKVKSGTYTSMAVQEIAKGKVVVLDLNGQSLSSDSANTFTVNYGGKLTIKGTGSIASVNGGADVCIYNKGTVILEGGSYGLLKNEGQMTIGAGVKNVSSDQTKTDLVYNGYSSYPAISATNPTQDAAPKLTIEGGAFSGSSITNLVTNAAGGVLEIKGGVFTAKETGGVCVYNYNDATIEHGRFTGTTVVKTKGATKTSDYSQTTVDEHQIGKVSLSGDYFIGKLVKENEIGGITVSGGKYSEDPSAYLAEGKTATAYEEDLYIKKGYEVVDAE